MKNITDKYEELISGIKSKIKDYIEISGGSIELNEQQAEEMKIYTNLEIVKISNDDNVSGDVYLQVKNGYVYSFDILSIDKQYNIVSKICRFFGYN